MFLLEIILVAHEDEHDNHGHRADQDIDDELVVKCLARSQPDMVHPQPAQKEHAQYARIGRGEAAAENQKEYRQAEAQPDAQTAQDDIQRPRPDFQLGEIGLINQPLIKSQPAQQCVYQQAQDGRDAAALCGPGGLKFVNRVVLRMRFHHYSTDYSIRQGSVFPF